MLSAHADADEIMAWLRISARRPSMTFITHGEPAAADALRHRIEEELGWACTVPEYRDTVELDMSFETRHVAESAARRNPLNARRLGIDTQQEAVVFMREDCHVCRAEGFRRACARAARPTAGCTIIATLYQVTSDLAVRPQRGGAFGSGLAPARARTRAAMSRSAIPAARFAEHACAARSTASALDAASLTHDHQATSPPGAIPTSSSPPSSPPARPPARPRRDDRR